MPEPALERAAGAPLERAAPPAAGVMRSWPIQILWIVLIVGTGNVFVAPMLAIPVGAFLALTWARVTGVPWRAIGYVRPRSWTLDIVVGVAAGAALKLFLKAVVMPRLGADPINHAYHFLAGNTAILPAAIWSMLVAGFGEETVFRGWMFERLGRLFGTGIPARIAVVVVTSVLFGLAHVQSQGRDGAVQAAIVGLVFGTAFAITRSVFPLMVAHAAFDLTALAIIYWKLETRIAHAVFR